MARAYFACGCFWGVQHLFSSLPGVSSSRTGYMGGASLSPSYVDVCTGKTGHKEAVEILYNPQLISYLDLVRFFFEIHNFEQVDGQGPDVGDQYLSAIFTSEKEERDIVSTLLQWLKKNGYQPTTQILPMATFWPAEDMHQDYYKKNHKHPYCHIHKRIFKSIL
ncbi:MAG: peptide-methionine (S)-S-oxide reductase MsrA [Spirochaetia bacterium]